ncbi:MAG: M20/M25/M40 family metallo-hydrolase [bacterium]|nr:M20/M25/M40 family metallo-hydrolase [bacterium]
MKQSTATRVLAILIVLLAAFSVFLSTRGPAVVTEDGPADQFSALRALRHVEAVAQKPHPMGSPEHAWVRRYLVGELEALGFSPEIQETTTVRQRRGRPVVASLINVMVRLEGREDGKAVLLLSHYDGVPGSFGAADDGAAVAAMLEALRILKVGSQLRNDVIFLFTDGEEVGLLGAQAFAEQHPWADEVGVVVNFEARGTGGPVLMFETSPGNGRLIREFRRGVAHPVASSYGYEVYKRMPNDTDFTIFRQRGLPGLNFAFIHGGTAYHTAQDSLERLDLRSVQHHGECALGLARRLGDADLDGDWTSGRNAVYFNLLGPVFLSYPGALVLPLAVLLLLGTIALLVLGFRRRRWTAGGLLAGVGVNLLGALVLGILLLFSGGLVFRRGYNFVLWNDWTSNSLHLLGLALVAIGLTVAIYRLIAKKLSADHLVGGGLPLWLVLTVAISLVAPGGSYLFALPLLLSLVAAVLWLGDRPPETVPVALFVFLALSAVVATVLWAPTLAVIGVALGAPTALLIGFFVFLLLAGLMAPQLALMNPRHRGWILPVVVVVLGVVVIAAVGLASGYGPDNRRMDSILYALDTEAGEASWLSFDRAPDAWTSQFLGEAPERGTTPEFLGFSYPVLKSTAPVAALGGAEVELLGEQALADTRMLHLQIDWPFDAHRAFVFLSSPGEIRKVLIDGREVGTTAAGDTEEAATRLNFAYNAPPPEGFQLDVEVAGDEPLEVEAVGQLFSLPELADFSYEPRPEHLMAPPGIIMDSTFVRSVATLVPGTASESAEEAVDEPSTDT